MIGTILDDRYELLEVVSENERATTFKAKQISIDRTVLIKVFNSKRETQDSNRERFNNEVKVLSELDHPNIIHIYDSGLTSNSAPYLVMDYVEGKTRGDLVREKTVFSAAAVKDIALQCCKALNHAHSKGIVHGNITPEAIKIRRSEIGDETVIVGNFENARLAEDSFEQNVTSLLHAHDHLHLSPEQRAGQLPDKRSDIYSLGLVLRETLAGKDISHLEGHMPTGSIPANRKNNLSEELNLVFKKCSAKDADKRFQTVGEVVQAINHCSLQQKNAYLPAFLIAGSLFLVSIGFTLFLSLTSEGRVLGLNAQLLVLELSGKEASDMREFALRKQLASIYLEQGDLRAARQSFIQLVKLGQAGSPIEAAKMELQAGVLSEKLQDREQANKYLETGVNKLFAYGEKCTASMTFQLLSKHMRQLSSVGQNTARPEMTTGD